MIEDLSRAGVREIPQLERDYRSRVGFQPEVSHLLRLNGKELLLSTDFGMLTIGLKPTDNRIVLARIDGREPNSDAERMLVCGVIDQFRARMRAP